MLRYSTYNRKLFKSRLITLGVKLIFMDPIQVIGEREQRVLKVIRGEVEPEAIRGLSRPIDPCFFDMK